MKLMEVVGRRERRCNNTDVVAIVAMIRYTDNVGLCGGLTSLTLDWRWSDGRRFF